MTPAVNSLKKSGVAFTIHQYEHEPDCSSYGKEAAEKLGVDPHRVYKTLVVMTDNGELVVSVIPVSAMLDLKALAKAAGTKKASMAEKDLVQRITGYIVGGVSPLAQKKKLKTVIDSGVEKFDTVLISGGKRGLDIEISPRDLAKLTAASLASIAK